MPELPEVETVRNVLKRQVLNKKIICANVYWDNIIMGDVFDFKQKIKNQIIIDILRRGKWLIFELNDYYLLSHLRMEGKYFLRKKGDILNKHEHVVFVFSDGDELRYHDTRKFGKMCLILKDEITTSPLSKVGLEPWDLDVNYLSLRFNKRPIKTLLLDQSIIAGIGNIYADEILFLCKINPYTSGDKLSKSNLEDIIKYSRNVLEKAIKDGGTTIKSFTSSLGVHGSFQSNLLVHTKSICPRCNSKIVKDKIDGRGSYYCPICQK